MRSNQRTGWFSNGEETGKRLRPDRQRQQPEADHDQDDPAAGSHAPRTIAHRADGSPLSQADQGDQDGHDEGDRQGGRGEGQQGGRGAAVGEGE